MALLSRFSSVCLFAIGMVPGIFPTTPAQSQMRDEYQVKAAFLLNFARFVEWPQDVFQGPADPITTCVLGPDPFGHWLKDTIDGRSLEGRAIVLRRISKPDEAGACQILFVSASESKQTWLALAETRRSGVLTIGESPEASHGGAVITFTWEDDRVRFEINTQAAHREKIRLNSRLLSLAKSVSR